MAIPNSKRLIAEPGENLVYERSRWSRLVFAEHIDSDEQVADEIADGNNRKGPNFGDFCGEVYSRLYSHEDIEPKEHVHEEYEWMRKAHEQVTDLPEWKTLHRECSGSEEYCGLAVDAIAREMKASLPDGCGMVQDAVNQRKAEEAIQDMMDEMAKNGQDTADLEQMLRDAAEARRKALEAAKAASGGIDEASVRQAVRRAAKQASKDIEDAKAAEDAFGYGTETGENGRGSDRGFKRELAKRLKKSDKLKRLAELAGRMKNLARRKQETKAEYARSEISSVEKGGDLELVLPSEFARIAVPELEDSLLADIMDGASVQYKVEGKESEQRGPIIVLVDNSGSMSGKPELFSKAFALGMLEIAKAQKRLFYGVHFDTRIKLDLEVNPQDPKSAGKTNDLMTWLEFFSGGGTDFRPPLELAVKKIRDGGGYKKADVVMITDDGYSFPDRFTAEFEFAKKDLGFTLYAIGIGLDLSSMGALEQVGAIVYPMEVLIDQNVVAADIYGRL